MKKKLIYTSLGLFVFFSSCYAPVSPWWVCCLGVSSLVHGYSSYAVFSVSCTLSLCVLLPSRYFRYWFRRHVGLIGCGGLITIVTRYFKTKAQTTINVIQVWALVVRETGRF